MFDSGHAFSVSFPLRIAFSDGVFDPANRMLVDVMSGERPARAVVICDSNVDVAPQIADYFGRAPSEISLALAVQVIPGGEAAKNDVAVLRSCIEMLQHARLDRHSYVIGVGGGAVLDVVGFAASIVHRGLRMIRIPTTVLAQNDAGIGVKTGINFAGQKNFLGTFAPPWAVVNDFTLLKTLPPIEWRNGTAEAVKVALIRDATFFDWIEANAMTIAARDERAMRHLIRRCAELHIEQITTGGDPFERGNARPLDFGHWAAHKIEQLTDFQIGHGHAVAIGMGIDVLYSQRIGLLNETEAKRAVESLRQLGFRFDVEPKIDRERLLEGIDEFREHLGGRLSITLLEAIGRGREVDAIDMAILRGCINDVLEHAG